MKAKWALAINGGAGIRKTDPNHDAIRNSLRTVMEDTISLINAGKSAVDVAERAVYSLEASGLFNAGRGAGLAADGSASLDAGICDGSNGTSGAVAGISNYSHPIKIARFIMERTDMVLMEGKGALTLVSYFETIERENLVTSQKKIRLKQELAELTSGKRKGWASNHYQKNWMLLQECLQKTQKRSKYGTVGVVVLDTHGQTAAAVSTGGYWLKFPGRIGDSAILGAGFYAEHNGAAVATGVGEYTIQLGLSRFAVDNMKGVVSAQKAVDLAFRRLEGTYESDTMGIIAVDESGRIGIRYNTEGMSHAFASQAQPEPIVRLFRDDA